MPKISLNYIDNKIILTNKKGIKNMQPITIKMIKNRVFSKQILRQLMT